MGVRIYKFTNLLPNLLVACIPTTVSCLTALTQPAYEWAFQVSVVPYPMGVLIYCVLIYCEPNTKGARGHLLMIGSGEPRRLDCTEPLTPLAPSGADKGCQTT